MATLVKAAKTSELPEGTGKAIEVNGRTLALFHVGGKYYATDNTCLHMGGPLGEGALEGSSVTCPWHGWQYDVKTGECVADPDTKVETFPVTVEGEDIFINL